MPTLLVADLSNLINRSWWATRQVGESGRIRLPDGRDAHAVHTSLLTLLRAARSTQVDAVSVAADCATAAAGRRQIDPGYKTHRPPRDPAIRVQEDLAREFLTAAGIPVVERDQWEADDVIASLAATYPGEVVILSGDRDMLALCSDRVRVLLLRSGDLPDITCGPAEAVALLDVPPSLLQLKKALCGDSSDGIAGVTGIGDKTAARIINDYVLSTPLLADAGRTAMRVAGDRIFAAADEHCPLLRDGAKPIGAAYRAILATAEARQQFQMSWMLLRLNRSLEVSGAWTEVDRVFSPAAAARLEAGWGALSRRMASRPRPGFDFDEADLPPPGPPPTDEDAWVSTDSGTAEIEDGGWPVIDTVDDRPLQGSASLGDLGVRTGTGDGSAALLADALAVGAAAGDQLSLGLF